MATEVRHKKDKSKKHKASSSRTVPTPDAGKNEGIDKNWAFQPPAGAKAISTNAEVNNGEFDWDAVEQDEDVELWVLRVPDNVKPKHLEGFSFDLPSSPSPSGKGKGKITRIGTLRRKHTPYDIWLLGEDGNTESDRTPLIGGEELKSLSCLLPRKSRAGKLYPAPKPVARHIIVSAQPPQPSTSGSPSHNTSLKNPPRQSYPPELLKHRFMPYGSLVDTQEHPPTPNEDVAMMEVDSKVPKEAEKEVKKKSKKRKDEDEEMQVDGPPPEEKTENEKEGGKSKKKKDGAQKMQVDEIPQEREKVMKEKKEKEKKKSKKRKGGDSQEVEASMKKSKKAKTTSA